MAITEKLNWLLLELACFDTITWLQEFQDTKVANKQKF